MDGFIVISAEAGRALCTQRAALRAGDVLACSGACRAGDRVHVVVRGRDGGQRVIAAGTVLADVRMRMAATEQHDGGLRREDRLTDSVVMRGEDIALLWADAR